MHFYYFSVLSHVNTDVNINGWYLRAFVLSVSLFLLSVLLSLSSYLLTYWSNIFFRSVCYICTCSKYQIFLLSLHTSAFSTSFIYSRWHSREFTLSFSFINIGAGRYALLFFAYHDDHQENELCHFKSECQILVQI
jgi:hypothetical protein